MGKRLINEIIIHYSATKYNVDVTAATIDNWHRQRGWKGIGYHFVVKLDGSVEFGRDIEDIGAHCLGHNAHSIGICYIGGIDKNGKPGDTRTLAQKKSLYDLIGLLMKAYPDIKSIKGHNFYAKTDCPGFDAQSGYEKVFVR